MPLTWPGCRANAASSNSFCISPCPKKPLDQLSASSDLIPETDGTYRSPFFLALLQSDSDTARSPKSSPDWIRCDKPSRVSMASSFDRVISASLQLLGRLLSLCFTSRWLQRILPSPCPATSGRPPLWCSAMYTFSFSVSVSAGGSQRDSLFEELK